MKIGDIEYLKIGGIGYFPNRIKWIIECIQKNFSQTPENFIEIWEDGNQILFSVSPTGMEFELFIEKRSILISGFLSSKESFKTDEKRYPLTKEGLEKAFKETIELMKVEVTRDLDSILKVKKK